MGTSSGVGLALSMVAVASFAWAPVGAAAIVCWPAALAVGAATVCTVPLGVRLAHCWPTARLKRAFARLLMFAAAASLGKLLLA